MYLVLLLVVFVGFGLAIAGADRSQQKARRQ